MVASEVLLTEFRRLDFDAEILELKSRTQNLIKYDQDNEIMVEKSQVQEGDWIVSSIPKPENGYIKLAIINANAFDESNKCIVNTILVKTHYRGQYYFITNNAVSAKSDCHGITKDIKINGSGIISIGAGCTLYNQNFKITIQTNRGMRIDKKYESSLVHIVEKNIISQNKKNNNNKYIIPENGMINLNENYEKIKEQLKINKILQEIEVEKNNNSTAQNISITIDLFYIFIFIITIIYVMIKISNRRSEIISIN